MQQCVDAYHSSCVLEFEVYVLDKAQVTWDLNFVLFPKYN
jgi:hypothetical protein